MSLFCFVNARIAPDASPAVTRPFWIYTQNRLEIVVGLCPKKIDRKLCKNTSCNEIGLLQNIIQEQWSKLNVDLAIVFQQLAAFLFRSARQPRDALHVYQFEPVIPFKPLLLYQMFQIKHYCLLFFSQFSNAVIKYFYWPTETSCAKASEMSNKGSPTAIKVTSLSVASSRRTPLYLESLCSFNKKSENTYSVATRAIAIVEMRWNVQYVKCTASSGGQGFVHDSPTNNNTTRGNCRNLILIASVVQIKVLNLLYVLKKLVTHTYIVSFTLMCVLMRHKSCVKCDASVIL